MPKQTRCPPRMLRAFAVLDQRVDQESARKLQDADKQADRIMECVDFYNQPTNQVYFGV